MKDDVAQGSLEYLLILAAILAIAVVVILIANQLMAAPQEANIINQEKYECALSGVELIGYDALYDGTKDTAPSAVRLHYRGREYFEPFDSDDVYGKEILTLPEYESACRIGTEDFLMVRLRDEATGGGVAVFLNTSSDNPHLIRYFEPFSD